MLSHADLNSFFETVAEAAETMTGHQGRTAHALPLDEWQRVMTTYRMKPDV